jgi:hypothetical protein
MNTYRFLNAKARRICTSSKLVEFNLFRINTYIKCGGGEDSLATTDNVKVVLSLCKLRGALQ